MPFTTTLWLFWPILLVKSVSCNFELGNVCDWKNENFNVTQYQSPLENSGPERAFEGGSSFFPWNFLFFIIMLVWIICCDIFLTTDFYIYSDSFNFGEATLELTNLETDVNCLFFAYHMWGSQMGSLKVEVKDEGQWKPVEQYTDYRSNEWQCSGIFLSNPKVSIFLWFKHNIIFIVLGWVTTQKLHSSIANICSCKFD